MIAAIEAGHWLLAILAPLGIGLVTFLVTWGRVRTHDEERGEAVQLLFEKVNEHGEQLAEVKTDVKWLKSFLQKNGNPKGGT